MTPESVIEAVCEIEKIAKDPEAAHSSEDALYFEVLEAIALGTCVNPQLCAELAIATRKIVFARWCA